MDFLVISGLNGLIYGLLLFMVSAGLTLIFGMMGVLNFAHASFYMIGAYIGFSMSATFGFWAGLVAAPILVGLLGIVIERTMLRRVHRWGHAHELLLTFGLAIIIEELIKVVYGDFPVRYAVPASLDFPAFTVFGTDYPFYRLFIGMVAVTMFVLLYLLLSRTRIGIVVRAAEREPEMAEALGHDVPAVFMGVFGVGAALAGRAGAVAGAFFPTNPNMALELGVIVFVVVVVGGLGSLMGSLVASLMIGVVTSFAIGFDWALADLFALFGARETAEAMGGLMTLSLAQISGAIPFLLMLAILLMRPAGLMGERS